MLALNIKFTKPMCEYNFESNAKILHTRNFIFIVVDKNHPGTSFNPGFSGDQEAYEETIVEIAKGV